MKALSGNAVEFTEESVYRQIYVFSELLYFFMKRFGAPQAAVLGPLQFQLMSVIQKPCTKCNIFFSVTGITVED